MSAQAGLGTPQRPGCYNDGMRRLLGLALCLGCWAPPVAHAATTLEGTLVERHGDRRDGTSGPVAYAISTRDAVVDLSDRQPAALVGQPVRLRDTSEAAGAQGVVSAASSTRLAGPTGAGARTVAVVMVNFTDDRSQPVTADDLRATTFTGPRSAHRLFAAQSGGSVSLVGRSRADGDVFGWYALPVASTRCDVAAWAAAARRAASADGVDLAAYDHVVLFFPKVAACAWTGLADHPGSQSWINGEDDVAAIAHELGHNMGVHHAAARACSAGGARVPISTVCSDREYGDPFDVMGLEARLMSSWHRAQLGQLPVSQQTTVTESGVYDIGTANDLGSTASKLLLIPRGRPGAPASEFYAIELRSPLVPFDDWAPSAPVATGVSIRLVPRLTVRSQSRLLDLTPATPTFLDAALQAGEVLSDPVHGIAIRAVAAGGGSASLEVTLPVAPDTTAPAAPGRLRVTPSGPAQRLEWDASEDDKEFGRYEVLRNDALIATTNETSFDDTAFAGLDRGTYRVDALDAAGNRASSTSVEVLLPDTIAPAAPTRAGAARYANGVYVTWDAAVDNRGIGSYAISRDGQQVGATSSTGLLDADADAAAHTYTIQATDTAGNVGAQASATVAAAAPAAPLPSRVPPPAPRLGFGPAGALGAVKPVSSPAFRIVLNAGRRRLPASGRLAFTAPGATRMTLERSGRPVKTVKAGKLSYVLARQDRRAKLVRLRLTVVTKAGVRSASYVLRRGILGKP